MQLNRNYRCACGQAVFFHNTECLFCHTQLGYAFDYQAVVAAEPPFRRCANFDTPAVCNGLLEEGDPQTYCRSCRLNRTIPNLSKPRNAVRWHKIESAKRRLVSQLLALNLPVRSRVTEDHDQGLAFDWLESYDGSPVTTGHANGIITLNIEEADDDFRERMRSQMYETYRTLLGHLRHESGHYYWERLIKDRPVLSVFREWFGDETIDYQEALQRYYEQGNHLNWTDRYVSRYASSHPLEDWAETWAHYLHMHDTLQTAYSFGLNALSFLSEAGAFVRSDLLNAELPQAASFLRFLNTWVRLTCVLNELSESMGQNPFYPFSLPRHVIPKLQFVDVVIRGGFE